MDELLEIKEFAEKAGISRQSVYKAYNNPNSRLYPYVVSTPKGPRIKTQALVDIYDNPKQPQETIADNTSHPKATQETTETATCQFAVENPKQPQTTPQDNQAGAILEVLTAQLQEKDKQIERLQQAGAEKDKFIQEQSKQLALLLAQSQELQRNNQILLGAVHGVAQQVENTQPTNYDLNAEQQTPPEAQEQKKEHKGFFKWLFG